MDLSANISNCTNCALSASRTNIVWSRGNPNAQLMIIGEAPGADEDREGVPFIGRSGQLLNDALAAAGLTEEQFYIANTVKCRPPENRNPVRAEMDSCLPFLIDQMQQRSVFILLGKVAAEYLLQRPVKITKENGHMEQLIDGKVAVIAYHPAYVLRNRLPEIKNSFFKAIQDAKEIVYGSNSQDRGVL